MRKKKDLTESSKTPKIKDDPNLSHPMPGWPGYRTRDSRSGYDPIDNEIEAGHTFGTIIQNLFSGQLRFKNPISLFLLGVLGLGLIVPLFLAIFEMLQGNLFGWEVWIFLLITGIFGLAMLINFIKNVIRIIP